MKTRTLGWTDLKLSTVGLGTWAIGGGGWQFGWGPQEDRASIGAIRRALDSGINWIDTAPAYGLGHAEEIVRRALDGLAAKPILATKCGRSWNDQGQLIPNLKPATLRAEIEASLKRLNVETIDLYQVHWPQPDADIEDAWSTVAEFVKEGKVRYAGVSNFNPSQLRRIQSIHPVASVQPPYSLIVRGAEDELLPYCAAQNIGVVAYSPMQKGWLTGKVTREWIRALADEDHRRRDPQFQEPLLGANLEFVDGLRRIAAKHRRGLAHLAIAWVLRQAKVTAAIVGARDSSQIEQTVGAADWTIPPDDLKEIETLLERRAARIHERA